MATISLHTTDTSDALCRRFAIMATEFIDQPASARTDEARVPLENLFRILQMFRYDAFADERRSGILELQENAEHTSIRVEDEDWHVRIQSALNAALQSAFEGTPRENAVHELQSTLRWLATASAEPTGDAQARSKQFFQKLGADLS